jgi:UDP-2,3-diacylglucosamine hydrolase
VAQDAVLATMRHYGVTRLIHGHTHRPGRHTLELDGLPAERIVLGDWYTQSSHLASNGNTLRLHHSPAP